MFVAAGSLLGITTKPIREGLTGCTCPQTKTLSESIIEAYRDIHRHVFSVAQRPHTRPPARARSRSTLFVIAYTAGVPPVVTHPNILPNIFRDFALLRSPLRFDAQRVHDMAGLSDRMIAAATGAKPSTVRGWLAGRSEPTGARAERLIELAEMIKRLAPVLRPESIPVWLQRPILALDDEKPIELIARGEYRKVAKLIAEIEYPGIA
jgi:hypothetical protein